MAQNEMQTIKLISNYSEDSNILQSLPIFAEEELNIMQENHNYGKKGAYFLGFLGFLIMFVILLIWVYSKNQEFLN